MTADLVYLVIGGSLLLAIVLPSVLDRWAVSSPMVLVAVGVLVGLTPLPDGMPLDPATNRALIEHVTELVVIVALMGVGLALDRPLNLRSRASWATWSSTWRVIGIAMPLCIAAVALLGVAVGLTAGAALLLRIVQRSKGDDARWHAPRIGHRLKPLRFLQRIRRVRARRHG